jgi:glycosyltransferase involved in cell wall biosynthesis
MRWSNIKKNVRLFYTVHNEPKKIWFDDGEPQKYEYECAKRLIRHNNMRLIALHEAMRIELNEMFGVDNTIVVNNGIDFSRFKVDESRESIRQKIEIPTDAFVIGHVGRIAEQKNPSFLIDIFNAIHEKNPKAHLLMVGDGSLKDEITEKIRKMNLSDSVTILKNRTDVPELMRAMNRFVFPSLYEGLAVVLVEAQRMHLPCIVSSNVADYTIITNLVIKKSLDDSASDWADTIIKFDADENNIDDGLMEQWDIKNVCRRLVDIYMGKL